MQDHNVNIANIFFENVAKFKYLGMTQMKIACIKHLRADWTVGMPATIQSSIF
jgi:hypothetical protein